MTTPASTTKPTTAPTTAVPKADNGSTTVIIAVVASVFGLACIIIIVAAVIRSSSHTPVNNVNVVVENKTVEGKGGEMMVGLPAATPSMTYPPEAGGVSVSGKDDIQYPPEAGGSVSSGYAKTPTGDHTGYDQTGAYPPQVGADDSDSGPPE